MTDLPPVNQLIDPEWYPEGWNDERCEALFLKLYHGGEEEMTDEEKVIAELTYQVRKLRPSLRNMFRIANNRRELIEYLTGEPYAGINQTKDKHKKPTSDKEPS